MVDHTGKTRGQIEAEISEAVIRFEKEFMGRGPLEARTFLIDDLALTRLRGVLTPAEYHLVDADEPATGRELIKRMRSTLLENGRPMLESAIEAIVHKKIISLHTDVSTKTGERIIVFVLDSAMADIR